MSSLEQQSVLASHRPTGFDYLRIILSVAIIAWHSVLVCYGAAAELPFYTGSLRPLIEFLVPSFFALSGFLVAGSLVRTEHLPTFLTLRVLRIFPALCCEVVISALLIGVLLTSLPLTEYFSHPIFARYFLNILGEIQYYLPGVFEQNNSKVVNVQLWTIPYELKCYILISVVFLLSLHRRPMAFLGLLIAATLVFTVMNFTYWEMYYAARPSGRSVVWAFLWGVAIYLLREKIPHSFSLFCSALAATWLLLQWPETDFLAAPAVAYVTVYIGLLNLRRTPVLWAGDISYGIYLYGFAIQQATYQLLPDFRAWHENFLISLALASAVGYLSWKGVELPVLNQKKVVIAAVKAWTDQCVVVVRRYVRPSA
jgi:peptidoglycan/LPS O-acetylase OafA/YrhL